MREVDAVIGRRLNSDVALINQISGYIVHAGGKRMRPKLVLLFANALGFTGAERHELAAVVEFIHTATLLHDDVVDESSLRRGKQTANALFGNAASVLVGDFLYSRAFQMMVSVNRMRVLEVLAEATNVIAEGEVLQLMNMHDPDIAVEQYLRVIRYKTAKLFEASARLGAVLRRLWPRPRHRLPTDRRRARLRRRLLSPGQERRRRSARGQADTAAADRDGAQRPRATRTDPPCHRARRGRRPEPDHRDRAQHRRPASDPRGRPRRGRTRPRMFKSASPFHLGKSSARILCSVGGQVLLKNLARTVNQTDNDERLSPLGFVHIGV
ncbi:unnamed protein product [Victoria cruziana]